MNPKQAYDHAILLYAAARYCYRFAHASAATGSITERRIAASRLIDATLVLNRQKELLSHSGNNV